MISRVNGLLVLLLGLTFLACASTSESEDATVSASTVVAQTTSTEDQKTASTDAEPEAHSAPASSTSNFPDILAVEATKDGESTWRFDVTVSSPYDSAERYADAWRVVGLDGTEYGIRVLTHHHASEQPFTRSLTGIEIPADITVVTIGGRDLVNGWGGGTLELDLIEGA